MHKPEHATIDGMSHLCNLESTGLEIMASQRTMCSLIGGLTGQMFALPVMLTNHIRSY